MLSIRQHVITFWLVICSFTIVAAQEDKTLDRQPLTLTPTASASTTAPALNPNPATVRRAIVPPATGTGTRNFVAKWLETGGLGLLGNSLISDTGAAIGIGTTAPTATLDVAGDINASTHYEIGGRRVFSIRGTQNTFVGELTGAANPTGNLNAFFGSEAGSANSTGSSNSFFGARAGLATTTGNFNAYFGKDAGRLSTEGQDNTFVGAFAGDFNTTGGDNSFFGNAAGRSNTTGRSNTLIGKLANVGAGNLSFATAIGARSVVETSNTIVLGRPGGEDNVRIPGLLRVRLLGTGGSTPLCRNASNQIATCSSSLRYKRDVAAFGGGLSLVRQLRPIVFRWKADGAPDVGLAAEDVATVEPLFVTRNSQGEIEGVKYSQLSAVLVNAVQEQQAQIAAQQEQLKRQQSQIEQQQNQLQRQQNQIESLKRLVCLSHPQGEGCK